MLKHAQYPEFSNNPLQICNVIEDHMAVVNAQDALLEDSFGSDEFQDPEDVVNTLAKEIQATAELTVKVY